MTFRRAFVFIAAFVGQSGAMASDHHALLSITEDDREQVAEEKGWRTCADIDKGAYDELAKTCGYSAAYFKSLKGDIYRELADSCDSDQDMEAVYNLLLAPVKDCRYVAVLRGCVLIEAVKGTSKTGVGYEIDDKRVGNAWQLWSCIKYFGPDGYINDP